MITNSTQIKPVEEEEKEKRRRFERFALKIADNNRSTFTIYTIGISEKLAQTIWKILINLLAFCSLVAVKFSVVYFLTDMYINLNS